MATRKTKTQIEKETPFVEPKCTPECPGVIIDRINEMDQNLRPLIRDVVREELSPIKRFMQMAWHNRVWLVIITVLFSFAIMAVWIYLFNLAHVK